MSQDWCDDEDRSIPLSNYNSVSFQHSTYLQPKMLADLVPLASTENHLIFILFSLEDSRRRTSPAVLTMCRRMNEVSSWFSLSTIWHKSSPNLYTSLSRNQNRSSCTLRVIPNTPSLTLTLFPSIQVPQLALLEQLTTSVTSLLIPIFVWTEWHDD